MWSLNRRGAVKADTIYPFTKDALVIVVGAVVYVALVYLHPYIFGVPAIV
jgi:hypothetical protein